MIPIEIQEYEFNEELSYAYKKWQASREYDQRWGATAAATTTATATVRAKKYNRKIFEWYLYFDIGTTKSLEIIFIAVGWQLQNDGNLCCCCCLSKCRFMTSSNQRMFVTALSEKWTRTKSLEGFCHTHEKYIF